MVAVINEILSCAVIVDNGSGVAIQPNTGAYSYVLTSKHVVWKEDVSAGPKKIDELKVSNVKGEFFRVFEMFCHLEHDAALLVIEKIPDLKLRVSLQDPEYKQQIIVCGCPVKGRNPVLMNSMRDFTGAWSRAENQAWEAQMDVFPEYHDIVGISGGGAYIIHEGTPLLVGVETSIVGNKSWQLGRLQGVGLSPYYDIISRAEFEGVPLAELIPQHLSCLRNSVERTFRLADAVDAVAIDHVRELLHRYATKIILERTPKPFELRDFFGLRMLIHNRTPQDFLDSRMWSLFLEYLVVFSLIDDVDEIGFDYIVSVNNKRRFLYAGNGNSWFSLLRSILETDVPGLEHNGTVVIGTSSRPAHARPPKVSLENLVRDISEAESRSFDISSGSPCWQRVKDIVHIEAVSNSCILGDNEPVFSEAYKKGNHEITKKLKEGYREFFLQGAVT